jgi:hypothetical protein
VVAFNLLPLTNPHIISPKFNEVWLEVRTLSVQSVHGVANPLSTDATMSKNILPNLRNIMIFKYGTKV